MLHLDLGNIGNRHVLNDRFTIKDKMTKQMDKIANAWSRSMMS